MSTTRFRRLAVVTEDEEEEEEEERLAVAVAGVAVAVAAAMLDFCRSMGMRVSTSSTCAASSIIKLEEGRGGEGCNHNRWGRNGLVR